MEHYKFTNIEITNEHISADVYQNQNYMMRVTDHILHIKYTKLDNEFFQEFQKIAIDHLGDYDGEQEEDKSQGSNIIYMWQHKKRPI